MEQSGNALLETGYSGKCGKGIKVALLGELDLRRQPASLQAWGCKLAGRSTRNGRIDIQRQNPALGWKPRRCHRHALQPVRLSAANGNDAWLTLQQNGSPIADAVAITSWGGYALAPFT